MVRFKNFAGDLTPRMVIGAMVAAMIVVGFVPAAGAEGCAGSIAATLIHPLPQPVIVALDPRDDAPESRARAAQFMQGLRDGGAKLDGTPTVSLGIAYSFIGLDSDRPAAPPRDSYTDFGGLAGGMNPALPAETRLRLRPPSHPHDPVTLVLRADLTRHGATQVLWVASLQCQLSEQEATSLAYDLGRLIGGSIGRTMARRVF